MPGRIAVLVVAAFAFAGLLGSNGVASAGWCWSDPVIDVAAGDSAAQRVNIAVGIRDTDLHLLDGPVDVHIHLPANVTAEVVHMDEIIPERVTISSDLEPWSPGEAIELRVGIHARSKGAAFAVAVLIEQQHAQGNEPVVAEGVSGVPLAASYSIRMG